MAQQSAAPPPQTTEQRPTFRTGANYVRVDAYPTKDGAPVQDLTAADFEILEDGKPQTVDSFEHVVVRPAGPQSERIEPSSQREMLQAAANPRHRVFVVFLDVSNVGVIGSHNITEPLIRLIDRILGPDDLVGIMTSSMSAADVVLARRTEVTQEQLRKFWPWGEKGTIARDDRERMYAECYPPLPTEPGVESAMTREMIARKRERVALESLQDLVRYLGAVREERKAIVTVTEGWMLYRPNDALTRLRQDPNTGQSDPIPKVDPVNVGPNGKLTTKDTRSYNTSSKMDCDADRMRLAAMDNEDFLRNIINDANRQNTSFYPIDPRGLSVFDSDLGPEPPPTIVQDAKILKSRSESLHTLALGTDGIFLNGSNDLDKTLTRISADLTSYYLLGYYSTNAKFDGGYRALKVRVKRPGVEVRARRGYRAASAEEVSSARKAPSGPEVSVTPALNSAIGMLERTRPDARFRLHATTAPGSDLLWITGELGSSAGRPDEWGHGATADIQVMAEGASTSTRVVMRPGDKQFLTSVKLPPGPHTTLDIQARAAPADGAASPVAENFRLPSSVEPLFYRRGPTTANRQVPTADLRFTRADRVHLELPVTASTQPGSGRLLDRTGQPLAVPVTIAERTDAETGQKWITADLILAPLAPADYGVEIGVTDAGTETRVIAGLRVVR